MSKPGSGVGYRPDIDGLRAVAVLSVLIYHLRNAWLPGGFVGVDIFFVISGFLITRNVWGELQSGRFSLADFYLRRIRRIAPVFMVVTAATLLAGMLLLLPADLLRLGRSAVWASLSAANVYFWKYLDTSYFAAASDQEPLLHTWSLGVEEQFYLLWPTVLMLTAHLRRARPATLAAIIGICAGSFLLAEHTNIQAQKFAYYMLPPRAGELMLGALLALFGPERSRHLVPPTVRRWVGEAAGLAGLGLIGFSLWHLDDASPFPGINAIYPCLGATLVILAGQLDSRLTRALLAHRPAVYVGLISYSLYLWHWPILAFIRYFYGDVSLPHAVVAVVATFALAIASYRYVEQPARRLRLPPLKQVALLLLAPVLIVSVAGFTVVRSSGLKAMIESSPEFVRKLTALERQTAASSRSVFPCMDPASFDVALHDAHCVLGAPGARSRPVAVLWGDSNAGHYIGALDAIGRQQRFAFRYVSLSSCPPVFGEGDFGSPRTRARCTQFRDTMRTQLAALRPQFVVLGGQWMVHARNPRLKPALERTIAELRGEGAHVVLLGQVPVFPGYNRDCEMRWARLGTGRCDLRTRTADNRFFPISEYMAKLGDGDPGIAFVDVHDTLCRRGRCSPYLDGKPIYYNPTHLSARGSFQLGQNVMQGPDAAAWAVAFGRAAPVSSGLVAGYRPGFAFKVRSQRHAQAAKGAYQHVVIAEFLRTDASSVGEDVRRGLSKLGFSVSGPSVDRDAMRYVARRQSLSVVVLVHPHPGLKLVTPDARGLVSFAWKDRIAQ